MKVNLAILLICATAVLLPSAFAEIKVETVADGLKIPWELVFAPDDSIYFTERDIEKSAKETDDVCGLRLYVENENTIAQSTYQRLGMSQAMYKVYETDFVISRSPHDNGELT